MSEAGAGVRAGLLAGAAAIVVATFLLHYRFILQHFSNGPYLMDSGWYAYLMASGDPFLKDPQAVDGLSFYDYHLSPYLSGLSVMFHALGAASWTAYAIHQGTMFALLAGCLCWLAVRHGRGFAPPLLAATGLFMLLGEIVLKIASYPHFEIALPAFGMLGVVLLVEKRPGLAVLPLAATCLVREDGGLYAAFFVLATLLVVEPLPRRLPALLARRRLWLAAACLLFSGLMFGLKQVLFWRFPVFAADFSGQGWSHLSPAFFGGRLLGVLAQPAFLVTAIAAGLLVFRSWRYLAFFLLALPLFAVQMAALRWELGLFAHYYAIPWLLVWLGIFLVAALRAGRGEMRLAEPLIILAGVLFGSATLLALTGQPSAQFVASSAIASDVTDLASLRQAVTDALAGHADACVSAGVAALAPDRYAPNQVLSGSPQVEHCRFVLNFRGDVFHDGIEAAIKAAGLSPEGLVGDRIEAYSR
ncbi:MAG: hypothetical protein P4M09_08430 [Devosia sp.]|nr:hypothetical protein [Devosia sp.]